MATNYPSSLDSFINPQPGDSTVTISHAGQHDNINDAVTALETKVGVNNSAVTNTIDYLLKANPEGFLINGQIVVSESGGNLTVALKGLNGQDPSATNPVYVRIGNTIRSVTDTSHTTVTVNAGTNWCNAGSAELATQVINLFPYLYWNSTFSYVGIILSRIPYAKTAADFSSTSTNEKFGMGGVLPSNPDIVVNIGRFSVTLSAGSGYTWSISGTGNVINRPIYETDWLVWTPTITWTGTAPTTIVSAYSLKYKISYDKLEFFINQDYTNAGSGITQVTYTLPFGKLQSYYPVYGAIYGTSDSIATSIYSVVDTTGIIKCSSFAGKGFYASGFYQI